MRTALLAGLLLLGACAQHAAAPLHGTQLAPSQPAAPFTLTDQDGKPFSLAQARGQAVALYFGFTHCKDVCPQTLALLGKARENAHLSPAQQRIVMITVDPAHDSPAALRSFFRRVGVKATGLTGTPAQLQRVYRAYGIAVQPQKRDIVHTDVIFLIDANGRIVETLAPETPVKDIAADLRTVLD
jgi:protein SCO1/2